jgi:hypothetical protein
MAEATDQSWVQLHLLAPNSVLLPHLRTFVAPTWSSTFRLLLYSTKIPAICPIRQTWPNEHPSCRQLDDSALQPSLQVALTYSLGKVNVRLREALPHSPQTIPVSPMGMTFSFC